jgi:hypothetical protein
MVYFIQMELGIGGIVYDNLSIPIPGTNLMGLPAGHALHSPATMTQCGLNRRITRQF